MPDTQSHFAADDAVIARGPAVLAREAFSAMGLDFPLTRKGELTVRTPVDGSQIGTMTPETAASTKAAIENAVSAFQQWRAVPAPIRGELIRRFGNLCREHKEALSCLVTLDCGKTLDEARGEVQEVIDICDFAVGLSRQLHGLSIATERPNHRMAETWHPLGVFAQISAFNFPVAVWSWGTMIALTCGNAAIWKPSEKSLLSASACAGLLARACADFPQAPKHLHQILVGGGDVGAQLAADPRVALISATGSTKMGRSVSSTVAARLGRSILELGGNNAAIITPSANRDLVLRGVTFSAAGTSGQRCTSMRRLIVHESVHDELVAQLKRAFGQLRVGNPLEPGVHAGPLIDLPAMDMFNAALDQARAEGGVVHGGQRLLAEEYPDAAYLAPALVEMPSQTPIVHTETFGPILYVMRYRDIEEAIAMNNAVPQGLSSAIFTDNMREAELFTSSLGSDCGIANVNIGTSGAEIGGAFGGEKETGGGRASGSDTWKAYMRRATNTINYSTDLPLAQGVRFDAA
ncbi:succinic semialdehyde dehydrogenase [Glycocaulis alkaliphilus]|uniref:aldehyde dehydrogenase (NAD(+)) n=2 Tax=Glycocaulis alkaliphilus TaxID=1434191 RepID=A0A3T0EA52_9PROT|nr:aldehyde dehydrogenase family protein [Glycocaulis alkaliphilus]AZU04150.1 succinic semialdehyde dehydrogenase [Glycocaulis alkaliphilus]GGB76251.1 aldehyde dehydrogenase [Glycocaulis alkaliphilus]